MVYLFPSFSFQPIYIFEEQHLSICLLATWISYLFACSSLCLIFNFLSFSYWLVGVLYMFWRQVLCRIYYGKYLFLVYNSLFTFLIVLVNSKWNNLSKFSLISFHFPFVCCLRNLCLLGVLCCCGSLSHSITMAVAGECMRCGQPFLQSTCAHAQISSALAFHLSMYPLGHLLNFWQADEYKMCYYCGLNVHFPNYNEIGNIFIFYWPFGFTLLFIDCSFLINILLHVWKIQEQV